MSNHNDSNHLLGLRFRSHHQMFSSLLDGNGSFYNGRYQGEVADLLNDLDLISERLTSKILSKQIPDTSEKQKAIKFTYTNYRDEISIRHAIVLSTYWGVTDYHKLPGMLMRAFDLDRFEIRDFALKDCDFTKTE